MPSPYTRTRLTQATLKTFVHYDPQTGLFTWLVDRSYLAQQGDEAGSVRKDGRRVIMVDGTLYLATRLAWLYMTGSLPKERIRQRNGDRADLRWTNLAIESDLHSTTSEAAYQRRYRRVMRDLRDIGKVTLGTSSYHDPHDPHDALNRDQPFYKGQRNRRRKSLNWIIGRV